jgi:hypothetical protein
MNMKKAALVLVGAMMTGTMLLLTAACGTGDGGSGDGGGTSTTGAPGGKINHPLGGEDIVLQVVTGGGFVPIEYHLTLLPEFTLYGDGTVIVPGPVMTIYPGPALPNLQMTKMSEEAIQTLLTAAKEAGLFTNNVDYGTPAVFDVPSTSIVINAQGMTYRSDIYALGFEDGGGLTLEQQQARAAINAFRGKLSTLAFTEEEYTWTRYDFSALAVFVRAIDPGFTPDPTDVQPNRLTWPLSDLAAGGQEVMPGVRKLVVSGAELTKLKPLLAQATQITVWESGGKEYVLAFRPLLPGEKE